ncbi:MAG: DUF309 domain-containing protein [Thermotogae bacterium]|nr:DUF309 domain-containing protein [Thermotogota bacterium]
MDLFEIRNWFAHNLCDYLREKDQEALKELREVIEAVLSGAPLIPHLNLNLEEEDPFTKEYVTEKALSYKNFLETLPEDFEPTEEEVGKTIEMAKLLFEKGLYFEVHEILEEVWMGEFGKDRDFLQALIQIGVAYYHLENFNTRGFELLLQNALELLENYSGTLYGIDADGLKEEIRRALKTREKINL